MPKTTPSLCRTENDYQPYRTRQPILKIKAHAISTAQATKVLACHRDEENRGASNRRCTSKEETCQCTLSHGYVLGNNARYFVYRVLLYSDGFNQYKERQGSAGGVDMLPLNLLPEHRRSRRSVRLLGLTPPGVNTSDVLHIIADDLFRAATDGIHTTDAEGNPVVVYIQVIGYIGDFLEIAHVTDLLGHNSDAACHLCFFRKQKINPNRSSNGYTTELSSRNSSCFRSGPRAQAIRQGSQSDNEKLRELQFLGMAPSSSHKTRRNPMFYLHRKMKGLKKAEKYPKQNVAILYSTPLLTLIGPCLLHLTTCWQETP